MYFKTRAEAGELLADQLMQYRYEDCAVVALSDSAVAVAEPIAARLHSILGMVLSEAVTLPGENNPVGSVNQQGGFVYSAGLSEGEQQAYYGEYHSYIDDQKREKFQQINRMIADGGTIDRDSLHDRVVFVVTDGFKNSESLEGVVDFLKPVRMRRLVVACPVASVQAVDRMHLLTDEIHCLSVVDNYIETDHYYDSDTPLTHDKAIEKINSVILNWR